jgi:hypothetical protein
MVPAASSSFSKVSMEPASSTLNSSHSLALVAAGLLPFGQLIVAQRVELDAGLGSSAIA